MKKTMKRFAAITATMMTISALGSISAFAEPITSENYANGPEYQNASVALQAKISNVDTDVVEGSIDPTQNDSVNRIWNVTIGADTLQWDIVRTDTTRKYQVITWDPVNHTYNKTVGDVQGTVSSYALANNETAEKSFNIKNDSNFAITSVTSIDDNSQLNNFGATFSVSNSQDPIVVGGNRDTSITINITNMSGFDSQNYVTIGTANITLAAVEDSIQEYTNGSQQSGS